MQVFANLNWISAKVIRSDSKSFKMASYDHILVQQTKSMCKHEFLDLSLSLSIFRDQKMMTALCYVPPFNRMLNESEFIYSVVVLVNQCHMSISEQYDCRGVVYLTSELPQLRSHQQTQCNDGVQYSTHNRSGTQWFKSQVDSILFQASTGDCVVSDHTNYYASSHFSSSAYGSDSDDV